MSVSEPTQSGSCMCGAVKLRFRLKNAEIGACHCGMCRKWSGGIFLAAEVEGPIEAGGDALGVYKSSEWGERGFCKVCGTSLFWRSRDGHHAVVSAQCADELVDPKLTGEIFIEEKPPYYSFAEPTHKMTGAEVFAMYAPKD